jgi:CDP-glucose 4,6-dehydratase
MLAERLWGDGYAFSGGWNFGPREEDSWPVLELVKKAAKIWGDNASWRLDRAHSLHEATLLRLDCTSARMRLGWVPLMGMEETLGWTMAWYKAQLAGNFDMRVVTEQQIRDYELKQAPAFAVAPIAVGEWP